MSWLGRLFRREKLERELQKELAFHIEERIAALERSGATTEDARRRALAELGGVEPIKEQARDARGTRWVSDVGQDVRYALRMLRSNKGFTAAAVLSLALGIGANASVFRVINELLLRPLDVDRPDQLVILESSLSKQSQFSHPAYLQLAAADPAVQLSVMTRPTSLQVTVDGGAELVTTALVSRSWFDVLRIDARAGRLFSRDEEHQAAPVAVISDRYWQRAFGGRADALGQSMLVNNAPRTIIGVLPPGFTGVDVGNPADVFLPVTAQHDVRYRSNSSNFNGDDEKPWVGQSGIAWLSIFGRMPDAGAERAASALSAAYAQQVAAAAADMQSPERRARALSDRLVMQPGARGVSGTRTQALPALRVLMGMVALVLLVACANLANLLLARGAARSREFALRLSIGARRGRLMRQLLTESLTLAAIGGAAGFALASWGANALVRMMAQGRGQLPIESGVDWRVAGFGVAVTVLTGFGFGLLPALRLSRPELVDAMKSGGRVIGAARRGKLPLVKVLVGVQVAVSLLLLAGAILFFQTFRNYIKVDAGFDREHVMSARFDTRLAGYTQEELPGIYARLLDEASRVPGARGVTLGRVGPATGSMSQSTVDVQGYTPGPTEDVLINEESVAPNYFSTLGIHLLAGREIDARDTLGARQVAVINETFAKKYFPSREPVGSTFGGDRVDDYLIVGVVGDTRSSGLRRAVPPMAYYPLAQNPTDYARNIYVRIDGPMTSVEKDLRDAIRRAAPGLAVREVVTLGDLSERTVGTERFVSDLAALFGLLGVAVASLGLYGTISYSVARRTNEIGVRLALGASPSGVRRMVVTETLSLVAFGVAAGIALMLPLGTLLSSVLYGVTGRDPQTIAIASTAVMLFGLLAGAIPAWRASRVDPTSALRAD